MKQFSGSVVHGAGASHYQVRWDGSRVPLCHTPLFDACDVEFLPDNLASVTFEERQVSMNKKSYAWGYEGNGPALLAITLLGLYGARGWMSSTASHFAEPRPKRRGTLEEQAAFVKQHHKAFTSEVIANLPDNWTMTMDDIDKWVKGKDKK